MRRTGGLKRGVNGLEIYVMCEIPSHVILAAEFTKIFDGFSISSNDLTQLILGVDLDSGKFASIREYNASPHGTAPLPLLLLNQG